MTLVGRDIELEVLARAVKRARAGGFHAVVVTGEPGIGKTTLLAAGAALVQGEGLAVVRARAVTHERDVPFALTAARRSTPSSAPTSYAPARPAQLRLPAPARAPRGLRRWAPGPFAGRGRRGMEASDAGG